MNLPLLASALFLLTAPQKGPVTVNVNAKSGEIFTGERTVRVTVQSKNPVTGVEFYVGSELRDKDTSTPYEFVIDSLTETEGDLKLRFKAFTTEGESGETTITVKVDNGLGKGIDFHLKSATEALQDSKWDAAITSGRIALKISPKSTPARLALARAYLGKSVFDKAQKYAEDAVEDDAKNQAAQDLLTAIRLRQAFFTSSRARGDAKDSLSAISTAYKEAIDARQKAVDANLEAIGQPTDANLIAYADAALRAGRYTGVINALDAAVRKDNRRADLANRLALAQMRAGRLNEALATVNNLKKFGEPDAYSYALMAVLFAEAGDAASADASIREGLILDADDAAVLSAQAHIALKFVRRNVGGKISFGLNYDDATGLDATAKEESRKALDSSLKQLIQEQGQRSEVAYYASALNNRLDEYGQSQSYFERAVLSDPLNADAFIEQANRSIALTLRGEPTDEEKQNRYNTAKAHFEAALAARPTSAEALAGLSLVATFQRRYDESIKWGEAAVKAAPNYAAGHVALGSAYTLAASGKRTEADRLRAKNNTAGTTAAERAENELAARKAETEATAFATAGRNAATTAGKLDLRAQGLELSKGQAAWRYFYAGGRTPVLPLPPVSTGN